VTSSDHHFVSRLKAGQTDAQRELFSRWGPQVTAYLRRSGFQPADVANLSQEVFWRTLRSVHTFDSKKGSLNSWIRTIAKNVVRSAWAKRPQPMSVDPELAEQTLVDLDTPSEISQTREEMSALGNCVGLLPVGLQEIVELRYVEALTTRGIAERMDRAEATVRNRLVEAKGALVRCLEKKGFS
jgi:RNA polymerase sigma-70 factor (ECF subfamily)